MFKFLRKYNKWILAVGGTLLMITFLIPFAFDRLGQMVARGGAPWANVGQKQQKVTVNELARVQRELDVLQYALRYQPLIPGPGIVDQPEHWYLLEREAKAAGLIGGAAVVPFGAEWQIQQIAAGSSEQTSFVLQTLAKLDGVRRMIGLYVDRSKFSDRHLKHRAKRSFHAVTAQLVVLEATEPDTPPSFGDTELAEQLAKYAENPPGEGDMGFGYRLPDRVKLEWLVVTAESVRTMIREGGRLGPVAQRSHWRKLWRADPVTYEKPTGEQEVPEAVSSDLLEKLTTRTLQEIARFADQEQLTSSRRGIPRRDGYHVLDDDWRGPSFQDLARTIQEKFAVALPEYHALGDRWLSADEVAELEGIGAATTEKFGAVPVTLADLVKVAREFGGAQLMDIQERVAGPPLTDGDGSLYLFRIIDTDPSRPPRSVDEVRDQLTADLAKLAHFHQLSMKAEELRRQVIDEGLLAVAMSRDATLSVANRISLIDIGSLLAQQQLGLSPIAGPTALATIGVHEETVATIIDHALALDQDVPISELAEDQRVLVMPVEDRLAVVLVRLMDQSPLTEQVFALYSYIGLIQQMLVAEEFDSAIPAQKAFAFEALAARHDFSLTSRTSATSQPDEATAPPDESEEG